MITQLGSFLGVRLFICYYAFVCFRASCGGRTCDRALERMFTREQKRRIFDIAFKGYLAYCLV